MLSFCFLIRRLGLELYERLPGPQTRSPHDQLVPLRLLPAPPAHRLILHLASNLALDKGEIRGLVFPPTANSTIIFKKPYIKVHFAM